MLPRPCLVKLELLLPQEWWLSVFLDELGCLPWFSFAFSLREYHWFAGCHFAADRDYPQKHSCSQCNWGGTNSGKALTLQEIQLDETNIRSYVLYNQASVWTWECYPKSPWQPQHKSLFSNLSAMLLKLRMGTVHYYWICHDEYFRRVSEKLRWAFLSQS